MRRAHQPTLHALRTRQRALDGSGRRRHAALPFGVPAIDSRLPDGGLALGALHEVAGSGGEVDAAAAALFAAGIAARTRGHVLWCLTRQDLFAPALAQAGLAADRVIYVEAQSESAVLACFKDGLREHSGLGAVIAEVARLSMTDSRRLQLAAEGSRTIAIALRRLPFLHHRDHPDFFSTPTAALTRWRVSALPSVPLPVAGIGRPRWRLELARCRGGEGASFDVEACDAQGRLAVLSDLVHGPDQEAARPRRAAR